MAAPRIMTGARAVAQVIKNGQTIKLGIFSRVSYAVQLDAQPAYILGRYSAASIDYTAYETVNITAAGWRIVGHGPHKESGLPKLQEMLTAEDIQFQIVDRLTGALIAVINNVRPTGASFDYTARQQSEMPLNFVGIMASDEDGPQGEGDGASTLPVD